MILAVSAVEGTLILAVIVVGIGFATWMLMRRRRDVWRQLARRYGLTFLDSGEGPRVSGNLSGRPVGIVVAGESSDQDLGGVQVLRVTVGLDGVSNRMTAEGIPGLLGDLTALAEERITFPQEEFNSDVLVKGDEEVARRFWNEQRQRAFLNLVRNAPCDQVALLDGKLNAELREIVSDYGRLSQLLDQLLQAAAELDAHEETQGR